MKKTLKHAIQALIPSKAPPLLVASMGRSGSTLLFDALAEGMAKHRFGHSSKYLNRIVQRNVFDMGGVKFRNGVVHKTHCFPDEIHPSQHLRVVFTYGLASEAVISVLACHNTKGRDWTEQHLKNLRANGTVNEVKERDVLRLEEQVDRWLGAQHLNVMAIRYETLWKHEQLISHFVGFPVQLPVRRERTSKGVVDGPTLKSVQETYWALDQKIERLGDLHVHPINKTQDPDHVPE